MNIETLKKQAAEKAVEQVQSGMVLGLGTGSTTRYAVIKIGELWQAEDLTDIVALPTSEKTAEVAQSYGIPLTTLDQQPKLDLAIDGADEVEDLLHRLAAADDPRVGEWAAGLDLLLKAAHLLAELPLADDPLHAHGGRLEVERLLDEVVGVGSDRRDRRLEGGEGGHHDDRELRVVGRDLLTEGDPVHPRHLQVGEHRVEDLVRRGEQREGLRRR